MRRYTLLCAIAALVPASLAAQQRLYLPEGARVRIDGEFTGSVADLWNDTLVLQATDQYGRGSLTLAVNDIERLEVSRGRKGNAVAGAVAGLFAGALVGLAAGTASCEDSFIFSRGDCIGMSAAGFAAIGVGVGALIGALAKTEHWETVPVDAVRVSVVPHGSGVALGISLSY